MKQREYPSYFPIHLQEYFDDILYGSQDENNSYGGLTQRLERLTRHELDLEDRRHISERRHDEALRSQRAEVLRARIDLIKRLVRPDERIREAVIILHREIDISRYWLRFFDAAWRSKENYGSSRSHVKRAENLARNIGMQSRKLLELLEEFHDCSVGWDSLREGSVKFESYLSPQRVAIYRHLEALARACDGFVPASYVVGPKSLALTARQVSLKTSYIQIFALLMRDPRASYPIEQARRWAAMLGGTSWQHKPLSRPAGITSEQYQRYSQELITLQDEIERRFRLPRISLTSGVMNAMALVATVVLEGAEEVLVTYDDVSKAISRMKLEELEKSMYAGV